MRGAGPRVFGLLLLCGALQNAFGATDDLSHDTQINLQENYLKKPKDPAIYQTSEQSVQKVLWRENLALKLKDTVGLQMGGYLMAEDFRQEDEMDKFVLESSDPRNRTTLLEHHFYHTNLRDALWSFDQLDAEVKWGGMRLTAGRFPIDISRTYVFRPNDFFGPFVSYQFDRSHKLGVDALELKLPVAPLGELRLINVAGYRSSSDPIVQNPWQSQNRFQLNESSSLLYYGNTYNGIYGGAFAGKLFEDVVYGAEMEGEITDLCSYHLDFHQKHSSMDQSLPVLVAAGLDRRLDDKTLLQVELFYNGESVDADDQRATLGVADPYHPHPYSGSRYSALVFAHSFVDLSELKGLLQNNIDDSSWLATLYLKKPISQNFDITLALNIKGGLAPEGGLVRSEFGAYPDTLSLDMAAYF